MKTSHRLELSKWQTFSHYGAAFYMWFLCCMWIWILIKNSNTLTDIPNEDLVWVWPLLLAAIVFTIIQYRRLRFTEIAVDYTQQQFDEAVERTVKDLDWRIKKNNKSVLVANRPSNWTGSWGEMITIKKRKGSLLLNSICSPDGPISVTSYGWNKKNLKTFRNHLGDAINNKPYVAPQVVTTSEWSAKRIVTRILLYPLAIFLIGLGFYCLFNPPNNSRTLLAVLAATALAASYLYTDAKMILGKGE